MISFYKRKDILLTVSILIFYSYLFQIYWTEIRVFEDVVYIEGGGIQRFFIKFFGISLLYFALLKFFSFQSFVYNFAIKIPLLYYLFTLIFVLPVFFTNDYSYRNPYILSLNLIFFSPILFVNFYGERGDELFLKLIKIILWVVCFQLFVDILIKLLNLNIVTTIIGGMGNANTFGLHLIIASLGIKFIYHSNFLSNIILILTWGTGSMMCAIVSTFFLTQSFIVYLFKKPLIVLFIFFVSFLIICISWFTLGSNFFFQSIPDTGPIQHSIKKIYEHYDILLNFLTGKISFSEVSNYIYRVEMIIYSWELLIKNPLSIIFGHPNFLPFWTTDSFVLALLVTLGLPSLVLFIISIIFLILRGFKHKTDMSRFASYTLFVYSLFFFSNRILDYWPSGFIFILVFTYLCRKIEHDKKN